jgi:heme-degrading monooxygenase HmoA
MLIVKQISYNQTFINFSLPYLMFIALSRFVVANQMEEQVKLAFKHRPHQVDHCPGFIRMEVISPLDRVQEIWLLTYWHDQISYQNWHNSPSYKEIHQAMPAGLKLLPDHTELRFFEHICD